MKLYHIQLENLSISTLNVRKKGGEDVSDILPSIKSLGLLQPLLVRPISDGFEIVAGQRRYNALRLLAEEGMTDPVPCIIMQDGDDAKAIEASLAENLARLPMDEIDQYKAFASLLAKGLNVSEIAEHFGVTERLVERRLAIAGLIDPILNAYSRDEIRPETLRALTMATKRQQKAWVKLFKSEDEYAPTSAYAIKQWLLGGAKIAVENALFDETDYPKSIIADLFSEERYFADATSFWELQNKAIAAKRDNYLNEGWAEVIILDIGEHFAGWEYAKVGKANGGKVFITCTQDGEVNCHEGYLTLKEARRLEAKGNDGDTSKPARPELTKAMGNYIGLHKHGAVQVELLGNPDIAMRVMVAHLIAGSGLWAVKADPQRADNDIIRASVASSKAKSIMDAERVEIHSLLGLDAQDDNEIIVPRKGDWGVSRRLPAMVEIMLGLDIPSFHRVLAHVMAETIEAHTGTVDTLAALFGTDMRNWWSPDVAFFDLLRDKQAINEMVREVSGDNAADCNVTATAKVQKKIVTDCLEGKRIMKAENWLPRYMEFPMRGYTDRCEVSEPVSGAPMVEDECDDATDHGELSNVA